VFEDFTMREDFHSKILLGVIILLDQSKKNPTKSNLMYLTIFMLLTISSSRELSMNLNKPYAMGIKLDIPEF
jgi:High-temperature-induced dauer-formation protein